MRDSAQSDGTAGSGGSPPQRDRSHDESMAELFREDPAFAAQYLNDALDAADQDDLRIALRQMKLAFGSIEAIVETAKVSGPRLERLLETDSNGPATGAKPVKY